MRSENLFCAECYLSNNVLPRLRPMLRQLRLRPRLTLLDPHLGEPPPSEARQGQNWVAGMSGLPTQPFFQPASYLPPSLFVSACYQHAVIFL